VIFCFGSVQFSNLRHHCGMSKKFSAIQTTVHGEVVASVGERFVLVKTGKSSVGVKVPADESAKLLQAAGKALSKPGISRFSVFGAGRKHVYAYALDPQDPSRFIREAADGTRRFGKMVNGKFRLLAHA
jgi:hypothetical protein